MHLRAYLQLLRLPGVFTAMADIFLGFLLAKQTFAPALDFGLLLLASSCLYLAGMVFNDVFDRQIDARDRPERPLPSGRVPVASAVRLGMLLVLAGIGSASVVGSQSLMVALALTLLIFVYDGFLKTTPLGPIAMGACRFLNVILGASAVDGLLVSRHTLHIPALAMPQLQVAAGLGIYIAGATWFARNEAKLSSRIQLTCAMIAVNLGLAVLIALVASWPGQAEPGIVLLLLAVIVLTINRRLTVAVFDPVSQKVQPAVKTMLLSLVMLDAALILFNTGNAGYALATAALLIPAVWLSRWIFVT